MPCCSQTTAGNPNAAPQAPPPKAFLGAEQPPSLAGAQSARAAALRTSADSLAKVLNVWQYRSTFVQGCACSTGFAGGGCCPSGASSLALHSGGPSHGMMGLAGLALGGLGLWGGGWVIGNSLKASRQIRRVQTHLRPQMDYLALLQAEARAADLPHRRIDHVAQGLGVFAGSAARAAKEQRFHLWVPGVGQSLAASCAIAVAASHAGLMVVSGAMGAFLGTAAPALFAIYGLLLAGKHVVALHRAAPPVRDAGGAAKTAHQDYQDAVDSFRRARQASWQRAALAWGLVGAVGAAGALVSAGICTLPVGPWLWFGASLGAAGFAMWQNSRTRFVPHLPISPHVSPIFIGTTDERQHTAARLLAQDRAIKAVTPALLGRASRLMRARHLYERAFSPQCGPRANQVAAQIMQRACGAPNREDAGRMTRGVLEAAIAWCAEEVDIVTERRRAARADAAADADDSAWRDASSAAVAQDHIEAFAQQDMRHIKHLDAQLEVLVDLQDRLQKLRRADMADIIGHGASTSASGPAQAWLWARLELLVLSGTLADAVDDDFIKRHPGLFSQMPPPHALPMGNVYVLPSQIAAFAEAMAPRLDGAFVHAFCNPRRIEAERDYLLDLETATPGQAQEPADDPPCPGETCCR